MMPANAMRVTLATTKQVSILRSYVPPASPTAIHAQTPLHAQPALLDTFTLIICAMPVQILVLTAANVVLLQHALSAILVIKLLFVQHVTQDTMSLPTILLLVLSAQMLLITVLSALWIQPARPAMWGTLEQLAMPAIRATFRLLQALRSPVLPAQ